LKVRLLLLLLLAPLLYSSVRQPDWGDDFAQYLLQTRNIVEGRSMQDNGIVADPALPAFAIPAYPVGFPLLLLPFYSSDPFRTAPYFIVPALSLLLAAFACFLLLRKRFGVTTSLLSSLLIAYHPVFLQAKTELLSDLPFIAFLLLGLQAMATEKEEPISRRNIVFAGLSFGLAMSMRLTGFLLLPTLLAWSVFDRSKRSAAGKIAGIALLLFAILNVVLFPIDLPGIWQFYRGAIAAQPLLLTDQFIFYLHQLNALFWISPFSWTGGLIVPGMLVYYWRKRDSLDAADWFLLAYAGLLMTIPYQGGGLRFLLPAIPLLLRNLLSLVRPFVLPVLQFRRYLHVAYAGIVLVLILPGIVDWLTTLERNDGPESLEGKRILSIVEQKTPKDAVIICAKPRAIQWYTGRRATYLIDGVLPARIDSAFAQLNARYLICERTGRPGAFADDKMNAYLLSFGDRYVPVDSTKQLTLWLRK